MRLFLESRCRNPDELLPPTLVFSHTMMGVGAFGPLAALTSVGVAVMCGGLALSSRLGLGVASVWFSLLGFHLVQLSG